MKQSIRLGVNIDHIATLRQARGTRYPDPVQAAFIAEQAGADGITIHPREDRRHIQTRDVYVLKETLQTPMNLEMAITQSMLELAEEVQPQACCFVPEKREELTTEGGLNVLANQTAIADACARLHNLGSVVSLFIDPDLEQIKAAKDVGASTIELHTGDYAEALGEAQTSALRRIEEVCDYASELGLVVNAGHGLNYHNVQPIAAIKQMHELNIGHSIIAQAVMIGLEAAVKQMKQLMLNARA